MTRKSASFFNGNRYFRYFLLSILLGLTACADENEKTETATPQTFTVSTQTNNGGSIDPTLAKINIGQNATFTLATETGYHIESVSGCGGSLNNNTYTTGPITQNCTVTASFVMDAEVMHTVTATAGTGGSINPSTAQVIDGQSTTFTVNMDTGFHLDSVSGCAGSLNNNTYTTDAITQNCTVTASFATDSPGMLNITTSGGVGGSVTPPSAMVTPGSNFTFTIQPNSNLGYSIFQVNGCGGMLDQITHQYTTGAITVDCLVTASFVQTQANTFTVSALAGNGGSIGPGSTVVEQNKTTSFNVMANTGFRISGVVGCAGILDTSTKIFTTGPISADCTINASFATESVAMHTVSTDSSLGGHIEPLNTMVAHDFTTNLQLVADSGYRIASVTGCGYGSLDLVTYTTTAIKSDCVVKAEFVEDPLLHKINGIVVENRGGTIEPLSLIVANGGSANFSLVPDAKYDITNVSGCPGTLDTDTNQYTVANVSYPCTLKVVFEPKLTSTFSIDVYYGVSSTDPNLSTSNTKGQLKLIPTANASETPASGAVSVRITVKGGSPVSFNMNVAASPEPENITYFVNSIRGCDGYMSTTNLPYVYNTQPIKQDCQIFVNLGQTISGGSSTFVSVTVNATTPTPGGTVTPASVTTYPGTNLIYQINVDPGYFISSFNSGICNTRRIENRVLLTTSSSYPLCEFSVSFAESATNLATITSNIGFFPDNAVPGSISPPQYTNLPQGTEVSFNITTNPGYKLLGVTGCENGRLINKDTYIVTAKNTGCTATTEYEKIHATNYVGIAKFGGDITPRAAQVPINSALTFTLLPNLHYSVDLINLTGADCQGSRSGNNYTVVNNGTYRISCLVTASFKPDMPFLTMGNSEATEGDTTDSMLQFRISLSEVQTSDINFDYTTLAQGDAEENIDYAASSGTAGIGAGSTNALVNVPIHGDTIGEDNETFTLVLSNLSNNAVFIATPIAKGVILDNDLPGSRLNDTAILTCTDSVSLGLPCPQIGFPLQDGELGRDVTHFDDSDGLAGLSFTKLDNGGHPLYDQAAIYTDTQWDCVLDNVTGLYWETKPTVATNFRYWMNLFPWFSSAADNGGNPGNSNANCGATVCNTEEYVNNVNQAGICGYHDWRLPSRNEMLSLIDEGSHISPLTVSTYNTIIDKNFFPNNFFDTNCFGFICTPIPSIYWTSTGSASDTANAWAVEFELFGFNTKPKTDIHAVRVVRGGNNP